MGRTSKASRPWREQWHVTADGVVIHERSKSDQAHEQTFQTFGTTRPVTVAELEELSRRSRRITLFDAVWFTVLAVYVGGFALAGGIVGHRSFDAPVGGAIVGVALASGVAPFVFRVVMIFIAKDSGRPTDRRWVQAGLTSSTGTTMKATEARRLIAAPGTTSGVKTHGTLV